jgi:hypothetical protein
MEVKVRKERIELDREAEAKHRLIQRAILMREKRKAQIIRSDIHKQKLAAAKVRYEEKLAHTIVLKEKEEAKQVDRYKRLLNDLQEESSAWITLDTLDEKITEDLFMQPATTGLTTKYSDNWRYHVESMKLKRLCAIANTPSEYYKSSTNLSSPEMALRKYKSAFKLNVYDFLMPLVGTGEDRGRYKELVNKFSSALSETNDDANDLVNYVSCSHCSFNIYFELLTIFN